MSSKLLSDDEFFGGSGGGGSSGLLNDDQFMGGAPTATAEPQPEGGSFPAEIGKGVAAGVVSTTGTMLKGAAATSEDFWIGNATPSQRAIMDRIDAGETIMPKDVAPEDVTFTARYNDLPPSIRKATRERATGDIRDIGVFQAGEAVQQWSKEQFAAAKDYEDTWTRAIVEGVGSTIPFIAAGVVPGVGTAIGATAGSFASSGEALDRAIQAGATREQIVEAVKLGGLPGLTEQLPIELLFERIPLPAMGRVASAVGKVLAQAMAEGGQEGVQQAAQNLIAKYVYNPDQDITEGVAEAAAVGTIVGGGIKAADPNTYAKPKPGDGVPPPRPVEGSVPKGAAPAEALFGQESAEGAPPPSADTAAGGPPPPPAATPEEIERERPNSPRLTPEDRASPLPNNLIDDGKAIFNRALSGKPLEGQIITPAQQKEAARRVGDIAGEFSPQSSQAGSPALERTIEGTLVAAEPNASPVRSPATAPSILSDSDFMGEQASALASAKGLETDAARNRPALIENAAQLEAAGQRVNVEPTEAQKEAGNYKKAHVSIAGMDITIENPKGSVRRGTDPDGKTWEATLPATYGYVKRTEASDGDHVDVYVGDQPTSPKVFVIDQLNPDTMAHDEPKAMLGFNSREEALATYEQAFTDGRGAERVGAVTEMNTIGFKHWLKNGDATQPLSYAGPISAPQIEPQKLTSQSEPAPVNVKQRATPTQKGPRDIIQFLAQQGGIRDFKGELRAIDAHKVFVPGVGKLMREKGVPLDTAREAAAEMGYFDGKYGDRDTAVAKSTVADLLDLIAETRRGNRQYASGEQGTAAAPEKVDRLQEEVEAAAKEYGLELTDETTSEILDRMANGMTVEEAVVDVIERSAVAFERETHDVRGQGEPNLDDIPFFEEAPDAGAAGEVSQGSEDQGRERQGADEATASRGEAARSEPRGRQQDQGEGRVTAEPGAEGKPQSVIPGAERISQQQQAQRAADKRMKPKAPQKDAGDLFDMQARSERQGEMFALRPDAMAAWQKHARRILDGTVSIKATVLRESPVLAAVIGGKGSVTLDPKRAQAIRNKHRDIPDKVWLSLPNLLADPRFVFSRRDGTNTVALMAKLDDGSNIVVGLKDGEIATITPWDNADGESDMRLAREVVAALSRLGKVYAVTKKALDEVIELTGSNSRADGPRGTALPHQGRKAKIITRDDIVKEEGQNGEKASIRSGDADTGGDRVAKARQEREDRLRAKGVQASSEDQGESRLKLASEALQPTDAFKAQAQDVGKRLRAELDRLGLKDIGLRISETLGLMVDGTLHAADGSYFRKLITVSLDADNPDSVLDHEAIHALRDVGAFGKDEWAILARKSRRDWVDRYGIPETYAGFSADVHIEEGIAHAYADWRAGRSMDGIIAKSFKKIRSVVQAIGRAFGKDFRTADDVFAKVASGEVGNRPRGEVQGEERFKLRTPRDAEEAQQTVQGMIARGQPLDRALRLPFQFFGGVDAQGRWKPGLYLTDKATHVITTAKINPDGRFGWLAGPVEAARAGLIDRYGLSQDYIERDRQRHMDERAITMKGAEVLKTLADQNVSADEAQVLQAILTGEDVPDAAMQRLAAPIRQAIDELGQEAVSLGLVSAESFERNRGSYLHRVYAKHEAEQNNLQKLVSQIMGRKRKQIIGDELKGRGLFWDVDNARLMRDIASFKEGKRGGPVLGEKFRVLDNVLSPTNDMLSGEERGKVARRVYVPADQEVPAQYIGPEWRDNGVWEVRNAGKDKVTLWRDYTKAERSKMGEILDARYTIGKTYLYMAHDLATGRFYKDIAENADWASTSEPATKWVDAGQYSRLGNDRELAWVKVPDTTISNTGGKKRWGALAGKFVRAEIWRDLNEIEVMNRPSTWRMLLTQWKKNKTMRNPVTHMNNVMSNLILMDMQDVRMQDLAAGLRSFINKDKHWQDANEHGVFGADMMTQEIRDNVLKPILEEIEKQGQDGVQNSVLAKAGTLGKFADRLWSLAKTADQKMLDLYRVEDDVFRMASYQARLARGETPEHAAAAAREQFLDYDIRAPWVNAARNSLLPFISYTYRAVPLLARAMATRPWKLAKYAMIAYALNALAYAWDDDGDEEKERASLRDEEQGYTWIGSPRMLRMPWRDAHGLPVFLDIRRWIPGGDIFDTNQGSSAVPIPAPLMFGGPLMMAAELALNKQGFTGDPITNDLTDDWWDKSSKVGDYLWKGWMPSAPWIPNSWYWSKIGNAISGATDAKGRPYSVPQAVSSSLGVKVKSQDVEMGMFWHYKDLKDQEQALRAEARKLARDRDRGIISQKAFDRGMASIVDKFGLIKERANELQRAQKKQTGSD